MAAKQPRNYRISKLCNQKTKFESNTLPVDVFWLFKNRVKKKKIKIRQCRTKHIMKFQTGDSGSLTANFKTCNFNLDIMQTERDKKESNTAICYVIYIW